MDLSFLRSEIDKIDDQLVTLFAERMHIAAQIADYKKEKALSCRLSRKTPFYIVLCQVYIIAWEICSGDSTPPLIQNIYKQLYSYSFLLQFAQNY